MTSPFFNVSHQLQIPSFPPLTLAENHTLDTIIVPPFNQTLRDIALKVFQYTNVFEEACTHLRRDPVRLEAVSAAFTQPHGQNVNGTQVVVLGDPGAMQSGVNIHTYTKNHATLLDLVDKADECLADPGPHSFEQHFARSTAAFGVICGLDGYLSEYTTTLKRGQKDVYPRYLLTLRQSTSSTTHTTPHMSFSRAPHTPPPAQPLPQNTQPNWVASTELVDEEYIRSWVFRYDSFSRIDDPAEEEFCVWKVVGLEDADPIRDLPDRFIVAFDWGSPHETREFLLWRAVCELIQLPTSKRYWVSRKRRG